MIKTLAITAVVLAVAVVGGVLHFAERRSRRHVRRLWDRARRRGVDDRHRHGVGGGEVGPAVTGALQSTLGNLPELFIVLFALSAGGSSSRSSRSSARYSRMRCSCSAWRSPRLDGGSPDGTMSFGARLPERHRDAAAPRGVPDLRSLGLSDQVGEQREPPPGRDLGRRRRLPAGRLRRVGLIGYLRSDRTSEAALVEPEHGALPFQLAIVLLAVSGIAGRVRLRLVRGTRSTRRSRRSASRRRSPGS